MTTRSSKKILVLWANGHRVGEWRLPGRGEQELIYDPAWVASDIGRPLSRSLPFPVGGQPLRGELVGNYFDNLLPDSIVIRKRLAAQFKTRTQEPFDLLTAIGRDCVGALQLLPDNEDPSDYDCILGEPMTEQDLVQHFRHAAGEGHIVGRHDEDDFRISIAGAHEKTALLWHNNQWMRPVGATPTTHIVKLPLGKVGLDGRLDMTTSVENEWLCSRILHAYGIAVPDCQIMDVLGQRVLVVKRFDRKLHSSGNYWLRLPQEDLCQAAGVPPDRKYEADGGPGMLDIAKILQQSVSAKQDLETFMSVNILFWVLAATDGHAKNFSLQLLPKGAYRLAPIYDVLSIWPIEGSGAYQQSIHKAKLAMAVQGKSKHYRLKDIQRRHFNAMAPLFGIGEDAEHLIQRIIDRTPGVISQVNRELPDGFPAQVADTILSKTQRAVDRMAKMLG